MSKTDTVNPNIETGNISVHTENIFPIIKKSLYSDHDIFLRELVSNAVDASQKISYMSRTGNYKDELGDLTVKVKLDKEAKTISISDNGIGMSADEVKKYLNQVAFSGAEEFIKKFKELKDTNEIIGQFGLGFYSAFMVADKVEVITRSWRKNTGGVRWICDGSTSYSLEKIERKERGTEIVLHVSEDSEEFLNEHRLKEILNKYCKFLPIEIEFEGEVINNPNPLWKKSPSELKDEDYITFFKELYPMAEEPLFWIHLNVDYPFNLTGILFFPKLNNQVDAIRKDRIHLYSRQVFITDQVENIVPDYLMLLQGMIDSPDIPLNVSRSTLQHDSNVRKISSYISRKVADKLKELSTEERSKFEEKWSYIDTFVKYGMVSDDKFYDNAADFFLVKNTDGTFFTWEEYTKKIELNQKDKDENRVVLYSSDQGKQSTFIRSAKNKGYDVLLMDGVIDSHFIGMLERKIEKTTWKRVDSESVDKLISKGDSTSVSLLNEEQEESLKTLFVETLDNGKMEVKAEPLGADELPVLITRPEFFRRMKDMAATGGASFFGEQEDAYNVIINTSHPVAGKIAQAEDQSEKQSLVRQVTDLALLSQSMLDGDQLSAFIHRSVDMMNEK